MDSRSDNRTGGMLVYQMNYSAKSMEESAMRPDAIEQGQERSGSGKVADAVVRVNRGRENDERPRCTSLEPCNIPVWTDNGSPRGGGVICLDDAACICMNGEGR